MPGAPSGPSAERIFMILNAHQQSAALKGGIDLDLFTAIGEGATTVKALAVRCGAAERGIRILADYLTVLGLLTKTNGTYGLTPEAASFLDKRSPAFIGSAARFLASQETVQGFSDIAGAVRKGGTVIPEDGAISPENSVWVEFARGMAPMMMPAADAITEIAGAASGKKWKVLDVAAGHGIFGIRMAAKNPNAEIVALDWANVLEVGEENARRFGVAGRWSKLPGDALTVDYGRDYDLVLLTNFLHHFDQAGCETILRKARSALKPGGRTITLEFVPNDDRVSPPVPAMFSLTMLASTPAGDAYTFAELDRMFRNAGFTRSELHSPPGLPEQVIVSYTDAKTGL
ncbi:MAG TPA: class I SAM-dependent methyltransferase [Terriglobia bacterium]|nr:class I SAM-dependent methyltransferase [Terriglobia bacterium]